MFPIGKMVDQGENGGRTSRGINKIQDEKSDVDSEGSKSTEPHKDGGNDVKSSSVKPSDEKPESLQVQGQQQNTIAAPKKNDKESKKVDEEIENGQPKLKGEIKQGSLCIDTLEHPKNGKVGLYQCHGLGRNQYWFLTMKNQLKNNNLCIEATSEGNDVVLLQECNVDSKRQRWEYEGDQFILSGTKACLDAGENPSELATRLCSQSAKTQKWKM